MRPYPNRFVPPLGAPKPTARERILAAWRGFDAAPLERIQQRPAQAVSEHLPPLLKKLRIDRRRADAEIVKVWNRLLDPAITAHAQPTGLAKGTLFVVVDSNVWLSEIVRYRRREILERLQHSFGRDAIGKISFRCG